MTALWLLLAKAMVSAASSRPPLTSLRIIVPGTASL
jgi:hypothetical protein